MIRRLVLALALVVGANVVFGGAASAAQNVLCAYNHDPLHIGVCVAL